MAVTDRKKIDAIGIEKDSGDAVLTISDHLDWSDELSHLYTLQEKLNDYISFIESGEIFETYPKSRDRKLVIQIMSQYPYTEIGMDFLKKAEEVLQSIGVELRHKIFKG